METVTFTKTELQKLLMVAEDHGWWKSRAQSLEPGSPEQISAYQEADGALKRMIEQSKVKRGKDAEARL